MNKLLISGHLGDDPWVNDAENYVSLSVAMRAEKYEDGEVVEDTVWVSAYFIGEGVTKTIDKHFRKGSGIELVGEIENHEYENKNGDTVKTWRMKCRDFGFPPGKGDGDSSKSSKKKTATKKKAKKKTAKKAAAKKSEDKPF